MSLSTEHVSLFASYSCSTPVSPRCSIIQVVNPNGVNPKPSFRQRRSSGSSGERTEQALPLDEILWLAISTAYFEDLKSETRPSHEDATHPA
mmetsp:Transcript_15471/g.35402  ORF Transcript_15471/g.35402 Transcript_15471/m.35402 type:complete len:92 (-) Transcript_15471:62-337(-)